MSMVSRPTEEWSIDFQVWFRTGDAVRCDPLTVSNSASRYLLTARTILPTHDSVRSELERLFGPVGLPEAIRSDNGAPFGTAGLGGLSRLSMSLLRLGIDVRFIPPGSPQDNGRHERMHRDLKAETAVTPSANAEEQQAWFDEFRCHYNEECPHEALDQTPPARCWTRAARKLHEMLALPWYDADHEVRRVRRIGMIKWRGAKVYVGEALAGKTVGLRVLEVGGRLVRFCGRDLGVLDQAGRLVRLAPPSARARLANTTDADRRRGSACPALGTWRRAPDRQGPVLAVFAMLAAKGG
jgi:hypothetical protein